MPPKLKQPTLPFQLLKEIGAQDPKRTHGQDRAKSFSRKDRRKAERNQKKIRHVDSAKSHSLSRPTRAPFKNEGRQASTQGPPRRAAGAQLGSKPKSILNHRVSEREDRPVSLDGNENESDENMGEDEGEYHEDDGLDSIDGVAASSDDGFESLATPKKASGVSRAVQERLSQDDAEIAELERKLGIKGRKSLPKAFEDDGLGDLLQDLGDGMGHAQEKKKRKAEADEWLAEKRRKAAHAQNGKQNTPLAPTGTLADTATGQEEGGGDEDGGIDNIVEGSSSDLESVEEELSMGETDEEGSDEESVANGEADDFEGLSSDGDGAAASRPRIRENPYVPPTSGETAIKYVPPSRRRETGTEKEAMARLSRQIRGLTNRISDQNLIPFAADVEKLYRENPRQHVSTTLTDQLLNLVCNDTAVADRNFLLLAAFAAAVYRVVGPDFGAYLVQETVERFQGHYEKALLPSADRSESRRAANLLSFLSGLYNFQLVGSNLPFDYIRLLLADLSELNAELLLRITRLSGPLLRQDDPSSLKDIVSLIGATVARLGKDKISVRTLVMIDSINDLKNNKRANDGRDATLEYTSQTKKTLGSLSSRHLKATEPLRMGLKDIQESDRKGKWWLVGASWSGRSSVEKQGDMVGGDSDEESIILSGDDQDLPDVTDLAREQMMNTDVRRSIFVALVSATDYEDAYFRLMKLRLNKDRQREIPNVLMQCAGAEQQYNPYYTLIAKRLCSDRKMRWSFQDNVWRLFRRLGESIFGDDVEDEDEDDAVELRRVVNIAKTIGSLISQGVLSLNILKCLNLPYLQPKTRAFVEVLLVTVLLECHAPNRDEGEAALTEIFKPVKDTPDLAHGLRWFIRKVIRKSDLAEGKANAKTVKASSATVIKVLATDDLDE